MPFDIPNANRRDKSLTTPIIRGQRSSCAVAIHRYQNEDLTRLVNIGAKNDQSLGQGFNSESSKNLTTKPVMIIRQDIVRCTVSNAKARGGEFSLILKRGKSFESGSNAKVNTNTNVDYLNSIQTGDWIMIYMKRSGEFTLDQLQSCDPKSGFKFLGIIENVREMESDDPNRGTPKLEILVTGRSFQKVFDTSLFFNPVVNKETIETVLGADFITDSSKTLKPLAGNTADQVVKRAISFYLRGKGTQRSFANENWYVPQSVAQVFKGFEKNKKLSRSFYDILNLSKIGIHAYSKGVLKNVNSMPGVALIKALPSSGTIWAVLQFLQNSAVNEMYTELSLNRTTNKLEPTVVHRQIPFSNKREHETNVFNAHNRYNKTKINDFVSSGSKTYFVDLPKHSIVSADIKAKNIGKSDHERINYVIVVPKIDSQTYDIQFVAGSNPASVQRYGLKTFQAQTSYVLNAGASDKSGIENFCSRCVYLIQDWFFLAHNLYNGTLNLQGLEEHIEVGNNLYISDIKQLFHIEAYSHTFVADPNGSVLYETEVSVSRGQYYSEGNNKAGFIASNNVKNEHTTVITSFLPKGTEF